MIKKGLFKSLKNIENTQKKLITGDDNESIYYILRSQFDDKDDKDDKDKDRKKQQKNNIDTKPLHVFDYCKNLSQ